MSDEISLLIALADEDTAAVLRDVLSAIKSIGEIRVVSSSKDIRTTVSTFDPDVMITDEPLLHLTIFNTLPAPAFIFVKDGESYIVAHANPSSIEMLGATGESEIIGRALEDIYAHHPKLVGVIHDAEFNDDMRTIEVVGASGVDDEMRHTSFQVIPLMPDAIMITETDTTAARTERILLSRQRDEMLSFVIQVGHDLRSSLQMISSYADILLEQENTEVAEGILSALDRISQILESSQTLAQSGMIIGAKEYVDFDLLVRSIGEYCIPPTTEFLVEDLPLVNCDRVKISLVLENIFRNAVEHGSATRIDVACAVIDGNVIISISNNGVPIDPALVDEILSGVYSSKGFEGGRGLSIAQRIVNAHGWGLHLDTTPQTVFKILIPQTEVVM